MDLQSRSMMLPSDDQMQPLALEIPTMGMMRQMTSMDDEADGGDDVAVPGDRMDDDLFGRRKKRLEMNRKAARESRRKKKAQIDELQKSVIFLTRENNELKEQNEVLRQMLDSNLPTETSPALDRFQAENAALKFALMESVHSLSKQAGDRIPIPTPNMSDVVAFANSISSNGSLGSSSPQSRSEGNDRLQSSAR